jgi:hypothetical protein
MAYFGDLTFYDYCQGNPPETKNVGWLQRGHEYETASPSEETLDLLWQFCKVSVMQTRGVHQCDLCVPPSTVIAGRDKVSVLLGSAEVKTVFCHLGSVFVKNRRAYCF